jgi:hypothetical protein
MESDAWAVGKLEPDGRQIVGRDFRPTSSTPPDLARVDAVLALDDDAVAQPHAARRGLVAGSEGLPPSTNVTTL